MREQPPTVPNRSGSDPYAPDYSADPGARTPGGTPTWPGVSNRPPLPQRSAAGDLRTVLLGVSLAANVLLAGVLCAFLLARAGIVAPGGLSARSAPSAALGTASPMSTPAAGWLQVTPSSVQMGCDHGQQTESVLLVNTGPERLRWRVEFDVPTEQAGLEVTPQEGTLSAGASVTLQLQLHTGSRDVSQQGVLHLAPETPAAGPGPSLSYTSPSCQ